MILYLLRTAGLWNHCHNGDLITKRDLDSGHRSARQGPTTTDICKSARLVMLKCSQAASFIPASSLWSMCDSEKNAQDTRSLIPTSNTDASNSLALYLWGHASFSVSYSDFVRGSMCVARLLPQSACAGNKVGNSTMHNG